MNQFVGIPFSDGEPSFKGANCITLVELFYSFMLDKEIPKIRVPAQNSRRAFIEYLNQIQVGWHKIEEPDLYCVVAMARDMKHPRIVQHFGIYIGNGKILHTLDKIGSHVVKLEDIKSTVKGFYKWQ